MSQASYLTDCITKKMSSGKRALIPFLTAGFPDTERFWTLLEELVDHGADCVEIGVPFSDPVADGSVVAQASAKAVASGVDIKYILQGLQKRKAALGSTGIVLMGYSNSFMQYGWPGSDGAASLENVTHAMETSLQRLASDLCAAGVHGLIIPDLPLEEQAIWQRYLQPAGIDLLPLVGVNTSPERMRMYASSARGYVYVVSFLGTTGAQQTFPPELAATIATAKDVFSLPVALGFGLQHPDQLAVLSKECQPDAVIFGSALMKHILAEESIKDFMAPWCRDPS